ncbi:MAG: hypothetical protein ACK6EB_27490, partial [Planctomyces sp.]
HSGSLDKHRIQDSRKNFNFADVAEKYQLINEDSTPVIVATWEPHREFVAGLVKAVARDPSRANLRALGPYFVNLRFHELQKYQTSMNAVSERIEQLVWYGPYDNDVGFDPKAGDSLLLV